MLQQKKEKLLIENLLSSGDVFARCASIIKPNYFDEPAYRPAVSFILDYYNKYNNVPSFDIVNAEYDLDFGTRQLTIDQYTYTCDQVEKFCKDSAFINAMRESMDLIDKNELNVAYKKITDAMSISLERDLGVELYEDPEEYLRKLIDTQINYPTGIKGLDDNLSGGLAKQTLTLFSANSGVGKSNMLGNLGVNYSLYGFNVLYFSFELPEDMIYLRLAAMSSAMDIHTWKETIPEISSALIRRKIDGAGSYIVKRLPVGTNSNGLRSYLKQYEIKYKRKPHVIITDYLDLMHPNGGIKNKGIFEQDKEKSEELTEILIEYDAIGASASQQNREALRMAAPDQGVIAGGISKVNTVHNYISLSMTEEQGITGEMWAHFLKTRTSSGKGNSVLLHFDPNTLVISDHKDAGKPSIANYLQKIKASRKQSAMKPSTERKLTNILAGITVNDVEQVNAPSSAFDFGADTSPQPAPSPQSIPTNQHKTITNESDQLLNLMSAFGNME